MGRPLWLGVVIAALATACGAGGGVGDGPAGLEGAWQFMSGTGPDGRIDVPPGNRITLVVEEDRVSGRAACNAYGGSARLGDDRFELGELSATEMACEPAVMDVEAAYLKTLGRVDRARRSGDQLVLTGPAVRLTFAALPPGPTEKLVDTTWRLETVIVDETATAAGDAATLRLGSDGAVEGSTGCRTFTGRYVIHGDEVVLTALTTQDAPKIELCPHVEQDTIVVGVVGDGFVAKVDEDRLRLTSGRNGLIYRSNPIE